ncbi:hypothetical protein QTP88_024229 [Uroleucon formosanum]
MATKLEQIQILKNEGYLISSQSILTTSYCQELDKRINAYSVVVENFLFLTRLHVESAIDVEESVNKFISVYKDDVDDSIKYPVDLFISGSEDVMQVSSAKVARLYG